MRSIWWLLACLLTAPVWAEKPRSPLALAWQVESRAGTILQLALTATAATPTEVAVDVHLPPRVRLLAGRTTWQGRLAVGTAEVLRLTLDFARADPGSMVTAHVRRLDQGVHAAAVARFPLPSVSAAGVRSAPSTTPRLRRQQGDWVWEYRAAP